MQYKTVTMRPRSVFRRKTGQQVSVDEVLAMVARDVQNVTDAVEYHLRHEPGIAKRIQAYQEDRPTLSVAKVGEYLDYRLPEECYPAGRSGRSRLERMFQGALVSGALSWATRMDAAGGNSAGYVSAGWRRTADKTAPGNLKPTMNLAYAGDERYVKILNDPINQSRDGMFAMDMVAGGEWFRFVFVLDRERFAGASKLVLPSINVSDTGRVSFAFPVGYESLYPEITTQYVIGVDLGIRYPAAVSVIKSETGEVVYQETLSPRVAALANSIRASQRQKSRLRELGRDVESALHRQAEARKKRELAILIGQEIAFLSHFFGNAIVIMEDLSWIKNTMENGRWNRGEQSHWIKHCVELNGGRVLTLNAAYSSQTCHRCGVRGLLKSDRVFVCQNSVCPMYLEHQDRDLNAAAEMAARGLHKGTVAKAAATREGTRKRRKHPRKVARRTPAPRKSLKYPGRDRTKTGPTPARPKKSKWRGTIPPVTVKVVNEDYRWTPGAQRRTVSGDAVARGRRGTETGSTSGSQGDRRRLSRVAHS